MTLRLTLSRDLRFGTLDDPDPTIRGILDSELCAVTLSRDFALIDSLAIMAAAVLATLDPSLCVVTLSRELLFIGA
jgi:hypothetical protein